MFIKRNLCLAIQAADSATETGGGDTGTQTVPDPKATAVRQEPKDGETRLLAVINRRRSGKASVVAARATTPAASAAANKLPTTQPEATGLEDDAANASAATSDGSDGNNSSQQTGTGKSASAVTGGSEADPADTGEEREPGQDQGDDKTPTRGERKMLKRIDTLTARNKALEARLQALEGSAKGGNRSGAATGNGPVSGDGDPAAYHPQVRQMDSEIREIEEHLKWCDQHAEGGEFPFTENGVQVTKSFTADDIRSITRNLERKLTGLQARRESASNSVRQELDQARTALEAKFEKRFAWAADPEHAQTQWLTKTIEDAYRQAPQLRHMPAIKTILAYAIEGIMADQSRAAASGQAPATRRATPPKVAVPNPAGTPQRDELQEQYEKAKADFRKAPGDETLARMRRIERQMKARQK